jgi:hypothetical protein
MKLIIKNNRIAGTATDDYTGPDTFIAAPADFDTDRMGDYVIVDGVATLPPPGVPTSVTMRQARLALLGAGLLSGVDAAIASLPSPQKEAAQIEWGYASEVRRDNPLIGAMARALGMTEAQLDTLFTEATKL